jgi:hydroxybutyrate-dimer hydrolase
VGLLHGCAVLISEKSTGPSIHDLTTDTIVHPDGTVGPASAGALSRFTASLTDAAKAAYLAVTPNRLAFKWAQSKWSPESTLVKRCCSHPICS